MLSCHLIPPSFNDTIFKVIVELVTASCFSKILERAKENSRKESVPLFLDKSAHSSKTLLLDIRSAAGANAFLRQASTLKPLIAVCTPLRNANMALSQFPETCSNDAKILPSPQGQGRNGSAMLSAGGGNSPPLPLPVR